MIETCARSGCVRPGVVWYPTAPEVKWCLDDDPHRIEFSAPASPTIWDRPPRPAARVVRLDRFGNPAVRSTGRAEMVVTDCVYCGTHLTPDTVTADHVIPISSGGLNGQGNKAPACYQCNREKGSMSVAEFLEHRWGQR